MEPNEVIIRLHLVHINHIFLDSFISFNKGKIMCFLYIVDNKQ